MKELTRVKERLLGLATSTRSLQKIIRCTVEDLGGVEGVGWAEVRVERPDARFAMTYCCGKKGQGKPLCLPLRNGGVVMGKLELGIEKRRPGMVSVLRQITRILAITLENRLLRGEGLGWLFEQVSSEVGRVDRYGGEFSICLFCGVGGKRGAPAAAQMLLPFIRQVDKMSAWRGRVAVVMPATGEMGATSAARRITEILRDKYPRAWAGIATYPKDATFAAGLIEAAEIAADWACRTKRLVFTYGDLVRQTL